VHNAARALDNRKGHHLISFDFAKAFDKVPHDLLIFKLQKYGFPSFLIAWVRSWLHGRTSVVTVNGKTSKPFQTTSGVPQGSVLGSLLFIVYINDLPEVVKHSDCCLYADDTIIFLNGQKIHVERMMKFLKDYQEAFGQLIINNKCSPLRRKMLT
jgi:retron-type reverse transcriptase